MQTTVFFKHIAGFIITILSLFPNLTAAGQGPVTMNTVKITYGTHTNSGIAIQTAYTIREESLTWDYSEFRNNLTLSDKIKYDRKDFQNLLKALSKVKFSAKPTSTPTCGGAGWSCTFSDNNKRYLEMDDESTLTGDYEKALRLIHDFISKHKPRGKKLFDDLSAKPHERGDFGEFRTLPAALKKYKQE